MYIFKSCYKNLAGNWTLAFLWEPTMSDQTYPSSSHNQHPKPQILTSNCTTYQAISLCRQEVCTTLYRKRFFSRSSMEKCMNESLMKRINPYLSLLMGAWLPMPMWITTRSYWPRGLEATTPTPSGSRSGSPRPTPCSGFGGVRQGARSPSPMYPLQLPKVIGGILSCNM